jgi:CheY-like chemotaxis protein
VLGNLGLLKKRLGDNPSLVRLIDGAVAGAERGAALTKRMLAFARRQELKPATIQLNTLVAGMEEMLRRTLGPTISIDFAVSTSLPSVRVDPHQLELALLNLAVNARDAMPDGGHLAISAHRETGRDPAHRLPDGEYVCILVTDSGCGMDEATVQRATEPFFTTKGIGKGTGLGLSMVHGLAAQSGGAMRIVSEIGKGTTVRLWLPVERAQNYALGTTPESRIPAVRVCRILVVDDDPLIVSSTAAMLDDLGHVVMEADSAARAVEMLRAGTKVDLIITDYAMPYMNGMELAGIIRENWPWVPVILASGYAELSGPTDLLLRLSKPYHQSELAECIATALDDRKVVPIDIARSA